MVIKNGTSTVKSFEKKSWFKYREPAQTALKSELHNKRDYTINLVGLQNCCVFQAASKEPGN